MIRNIEDIEVGVKFKSLNPEITDEYMIALDDGGKRVLVNLTKFRVSSVWLNVSVNDGKEKPRAIQRFEDDGNPHVD